MSSEVQPKKSVSLKARIEQVISIVIPSVFIITNTITFNPSKSFYCDYIIFIYSSCLLMLVVVKLTGVKVVNRVIKDKFALVDGIKGKGIVVFCISLLYVSNGGWRTGVAVLLLINGLYLLLIEWLWPSKDNLLNTPSEYNVRGNKMNREGNVERNKNTNNANTVELDKTEEHKSKDNPYDVGEDF